MARESSRARSATGPGFERAGRSRGASCKRRPLLFPSLIFQTVGCLPELGLLAAGGQLSISAGLSPLR